MLSKSSGWMPDATTFPPGIELPDPASQAVRERLLRVAPLPTSVLLLGETGSGKDHWARRLAEWSGRRPFVALHAGDVPDTLLESEWFGCRAGAFTGADQDRPGRWAQAGNGVLLLNAIDLLPLALQAKLLRVIERRSYFPLGSGKEVAVNARLLFSADDHIEDKVAQGLFRADLYYRIATYRVVISPLRERGQDILPLIGHFAALLGVPVSLGPEVHRALGAHRWPGNVRELENFVRACALEAGEVSDTVARRWLADNAGTPAPGGTITLAELERRHVLYWAARIHRRDRLATLLGISRKSLYNKLKRYEKD